MGERLTDKYRHSGGKLLTLRIDACIIQGKMCERMTAIWRLCGRLR